MALTHDKGQRQLIFQVVEHHCWLIAAPLKRNFAYVDDYLLPTTFQIAQYGGAVNITFYFILICACKKTSTDLFGLKELRYPLL